MLTNITCNPKQVSQIKSKSAVHWVPTNSVLQRIHSVFVIASTHVSHCEVTVQTIKGLMNVLKLAWIILHAPIR